jgi:WD40 repeat protein
VGVENRACIPVFRYEVNTPPSPPVTTKAEDDTDLVLIEDLKSWFVSLKISSTAARRYAKILVEKNTERVIKLRRKLEKNPDYLKEIGGFDEDDIEDIKERLSGGIASEGEKDLFSAVGTSVGEVISRTASGKEQVYGNPVAVENYQPGVSSESHSDAVYALSWSHVGNKIASGSRDYTIKLWDGKSLELLRTLIGHSSRVQSVSWNHDGSQIVSGSSDKTIKIWDSSIGKVLRTLKGHEDSVFSVTWDHEGKKIASGSYDKTIKIWDAVTGELMKSLEGGHSKYVYSVSWSPDGSKIVSGSWDTTVKIWDVVRGTVLRTMTDHSGPVCSVAWNHDGDKIVSSSYDKTVRIWNAYNGELMKSLVGHSSGAKSVAWSHDDQKIASCSDDEKKVIIWDATTGKSLNTLQLTTDITALDWSPDDTHLVYDEENHLRTFSISLKHSVK